MNQDWVDWEGGGEVVEGQMRLHSIEKRSAELTSSRTNPLYSLLIFPIDWPSRDFILNQSTSNRFANFDWSEGFGNPVVTWKAFSHGKHAPSKMQHGPTTLRIVCLSASRMSNVALQKLPLEKRKWKINGTNDVGNTRVLYVCFT